MAVVLLVGALLRCYNLGVPSMWTDEMLVAQNASMSPAYIFDLSRNVEVHPPYFYFFYKALMLLGTSDFWLRLPSAVFGVATLAVLWQVGRRHLGDRFAALAAMAVLAVHPLHIWISRQVRPYALIGLCAALAVGWLLDYLRDGDARFARRNLLANVPIALTHYLGLLALGAQWLVAASASLRRRVPGLRALCLYGAGMALCLAPSLYFFWQAKFVRREAVIKAGKGFGPALGAVARTLGDVLSFGAGFPLAWLAMAGLMAAGVAALRSRRGPGGSLAALFVLPPAMLVAAQYASHLYAVHLSFLLVPAALLAGAGLGALAPAPWRRPRSVLVLVCLLSGAFVGLHGAAYYGPKGVVATWWHQGFYKDIALFLRRNFKPTDMVSFSDLSLCQSVDWYAGLMPGGQDAGVPERQVLEGDGPMAQAVFVTNLPGFGHYFRDEAQFREIFGASGKVSRRDNMRIYQTAIARAPGLVLDGPRAVLELTARPTDVYARAWSLRDLSVWPYHGCALFPTMLSRDGEVVYRIVNRATPLPARFALLLDFDLEAAGNLLRLESRFDEGPWTTLLEQRKKNHASSRLVRFDRSEPFSVLWLRVVLRSTGQKPIAETGPLGQARFWRLVLFAEPQEALFGSRTLALGETGMGALELQADGGLGRWGLGDCATLRFDADRPQRLRAHYRFASPLSGQQVAVLHDGRPVATHAALEADKETEGVLDIDVPTGPGTVALCPSLWNHKTPDATFAANDPRGIALLLRRFSLESAGQQGPPPPPQTLPR